MAFPLEDIELMEVEADNASDTTSQASESEGSTSSSSDEDGQSNNGGPAGSASSSDGADGESDRGESQGEMSSSGDDSEASSSVESPAAIPTINKGKQRAGEPPKSILKKDNGKERTIDTDIVSSEDCKSSQKTKRCARCGREVQKSYLRKLSRPSNTIEDLDWNTIHNLEVYPTAGPVVALCDWCSSAASMLDQYKGVAVEGERIVKNHLTNSMCKKYARETLARERRFAELDKINKKKRPSGKPAAAATVSFTQPPTSAAAAGVQSDDAASVMSSVSRVSFGTLPPPVDGVGTIRSRRSFSRAHEDDYEPGRWSWEAVRERGDLEEDSDNSSDSGDAGENSAQGAAPQRKSQENSSRGWLDTSGRNVKYYEFYGTAKTKEDKEEEKKEARKTRPPQWLDPETHTIRRKREGSVKAEVKWLVKAWCCCR